jgi:phage-related protein (TIGR01555 family)
MAWGGTRPGAGRPKAKDGKEPKKKTVAPGPSQTLVPIKRTLKITQRHIEDSLRKRPDGVLSDHVFVAAQPMPGVVPKGVKIMAMDDAIIAPGQWAGGLFNAIVANGLTFLGYPYLSELAQRPEYRVISDVIATESTRKWIKLNGKSSKQDKEEKDDLDSDRGIEPEKADPDAPKVDAKRTAERIKELEDDQERLEVRDKFATLAAHDGYFGRAHLFVDGGKVDLDNDKGELAKSIGDGRNAMSQGKIGKGWLRNLHTIEPVWTYPQTYNATNPLKPDWYNPQQWYVMGKEISATRLLTFIGQPVPDLLKPAYSFGGLSRSQMAKPYVDYWLRNRDSVGNIINAFSVMVLQTDLASTLAPVADGMSLMDRVALFNNLRDNQGLMVTDKAGEDFKNVSAPLGTLDALLAQSQEHMASVSRIPLVKLLGISPHGLNASAEGELRAFYDTINAFQHRFFRPHLHRVINLEMLSLWGEVDPDITFDFEPLWSLDEKAAAEVQKTKAETSQVLIDTGTVSPEENRQRVANDPDSGFDGIDVEDLPDLAEEEEQGLEPEGGKPDPKAEGEPEGGEPQGVDEAARALEAYSEELIDAQIAAEEPEEDFADIEEP